MIAITDETSADLREEVRSRYAQAARAVLQPRPGVTASCCESSPADSCCGGSATDSCRGTGSAALDSAGFAGRLYGEGETDGLPQEAVLASLGCGNPLAVADLHEGERVLDLGSGGGIDVLLSARRVGPSGFAYGVDMTDEMLALARASAAKAGAGNVEFLKGEIEALPLPDAAVDVVIAGAGLADAMFAVPALSPSHHHRGGAPILLSEVIATAGLLFVIVALVRTGRIQHVAWAVGAWIGAAYWFTVSTSFANPAVTIGRTLTNTYAGIAPASAPAFIAAQLVGGVIGTLLAVAVYPARPARARADPPAQVTC